VARNRLTCRPAIGPVRCTVQPHLEPRITDMKLRVEVLSPTTAAYDRGDKFAAYPEILAGGELTRSPAPSMTTVCPRLRLVLSREQSAM
jgi:hypothetical protein